MVIRKATQVDAPALAEIHVSAWRTAYSGHMPNSVLDSLSIEKRIVDWQQWLSQPGLVTTLVVEIEGKLVAFCVFGPSRDEDKKERSVCEILALNVHPRLWRRGYGKTLCEAVLLMAQQAQWKTITLWVLKANERARLFYQTIGFSPDGAERLDSDLEGVTLHEVRYGKELEANVI